MLLPEKAAKSFRCLSSLFRFITGVVCFFVIADIISPFQQLQATPAINLPPYSKNVMTSLTCVVAGVSQERIEQEFIKSNVHPTGNLDYHLGLAFCYTRPRRKRWFANFDDIAI